MPIDPVSTKIIAQLAIKTITDEESRNKIIIAVIIPIIIVLLILSMFVYILSSPLSFITNFFTGENEKFAVEQFKNKYQSTVQLQIGAVSFNGKYPMPAEGEVAPTYGMRLHPIAKVYKMHAGIDLNTSWHCPIMTISDGKVIKVGIGSGYGNYIIIKHELPDETFYSLYAHLSKVYVLPNQEVKQGNIIAAEGGEPNVDLNPGMSTGHHLHFEIRRTESADSHVNPALYLFKQDNK